jgi:lipoprotein-anchoring transpeptidase ErfK/SrfK
MTQDITQQAGQDSSPLDEFASGDRKRSGLKIAAAVVVGLLVLAGAGVAATSMWRGESVTTTLAPDPVVRPALSAPLAKEVSYTATPADGAGEVNPARLPQLQAENATVESATLVPAGGGSAVEGTVSDDGAAWTAAGPLEFNTEYTFEFTLVDIGGNSTQHSRTFHTVTPPNEADASMYPLDGTTVGTGQPIEINFSEPVTNKAAVEKAIRVTSSSGQKGAFYWLQDTKVRYRPKDFWEPHSTITVDMQLFGVEFGNGMIGNFNKEFTLKTHNTRLAVVDNNTKTMKVFIDGELTRTFPITLGTEEWPSTKGYHVVMEQYESTRFNAETIGLKRGDDAYYESVVVKHASRISNGGAFVHEALPAAQVALGRVNVSHGCIGMSPEGAKYFYDTFGAGDVVQVLNTGYGPMYVWDGFGDWNVPWKEWKNQPSQG